MSRNENDGLHRSISLRPHPFHEYPDRVPDSPTRASARGYALPGGIVPVLPVADPSSNTKAPATSTAYETSEHTSNDPVARPGFTRSGSVSDSSDVEGQRLPSYSEESDPYHLSSSIRTAEQLDEIHANTSRKRSGNKSTCAPFASTRNALQAKKIQDFYESQNENIERLLKPVDEHVRQAREEAGADHLKFKIAVNGSFVANLLLAVIQVYGAVSSGSLSLFTTMADAVFDPLSNVTLILSNRAVNSVDPRRFPSGKARIETAGNIVFCFLMTSVSFILIVLSSKELAEGSTSETSTFHFPSVIAVAVAFTTKFALFLYCWSLRNKYSQIRILWEDHRNDLFINGFGILTSVGGSKLRWWIDPMGAIILSCLIAFLWLRTAYSEFQLLIGVSADTKMLQLLTYISMTHSPHILGLDTVRAWHSGPRLIVEVDIVLDQNMPLKESHDIAEALQTKLESLPDVERCYVHCDFEVSHKPEHFTKKQL